MKPTAKGAMIGAAGMFLLLMLIALLVVLTGGYNVAATDRHNPIVGWALTTTMTNSVQSQADDVQAPSEFTPAMVGAGAGEYKSMCVHCHGGIGEARAEWAETMRPKPPSLVHAAEQWSPQEVFWLIKNGVKMTGMPAFGPTHDDPTIWNIAAFVKQLPNMEEEEYAAFEVGHRNEGHSHDGAEEASGEEGRKEIPTSNHPHEQGASPHQD